MTVSAGFYALGYLTGVAVFVRMARRRRIATEGIMAVMGAGLLGGLAGANLAQWLLGGAAGKTVLGGVAGGYLTVIGYKRYLGLTRPTGDLFAPALCAGEAVGRWGCFFGGCCYGKPAAVAWAVWQHGAFRHPTQLYLSAAGVAILAALWRFERASPPENGLFFLQGLLYCAARFAIEFFRETHAVGLGLSAAQWACLAGLAFFALKLWRLLRRERTFHAELSQLRPAG
jgi:phosphatidylglycerol---prolipoprotein diacylglyceryl transferase